MRNEKSIVELSEMIEDNFIMLFCSIPMVYEKKDSWYHVYMIGFK